MSLPLRRAAATRTAGFRRNGPAAVALSCRPISNTTAVKSKLEEGKEQAGISFKDMLHGNPLSLPRLPIPQLEDTVSRYLQVRRARSAVLGLALAVVRGFACGDVMVGIGMFRFTKRVVIDPLRTLARVVQELDTAVS